jgi:hypothetical protein
MRFRIGAISCALGTTLAGAASVMPGSAAAQRFTPGTRFGIAGGVAVLGSASRYAGSTRAAHLQLAFDRTVRRGVIAELLVDAYEMDAVEAVPDCAAVDYSGSRTACEAQTVRAGSLMGVSAAARFYPWLNGVALAAETGLYYAPSVRGSVSPMSGALGAGATYEFSSSRFLPVLGFRYLWMPSNPGGVRWIASPELGVRF